MRLLSKATKLCSLYRTGQRASYATGGGVALKSAGSPDVVIVGAGHNGLVAATLLAKQGMRVYVVEAKDVVGGACRTGGASSADRQWRQPPGS